MTKFGMIIHLDEKVFFRPAAPSGVFFSTLSVCLDHWNRATKFVMVIRLGRENVANNRLHPNPRRHDLELIFSPIL